ncbi:hypothetical protein [Pseudorhodoferax soli]|uniref:Uncharacterized protein n=1 Tax=Pseudorhodoferax soli TaxID=545864 RepID=A0A368XTM6_9BURK|nr:hypothetical protein [Pseudorhodoferax soli]RCW70506.1 hypothetical protein DES41_105449 [Pseudorhodoferax soli]
MNLLSLVNLSLKSDEVIEILEHYDVKVIYDFDRLRENSPDVYWASFHEAGFGFRFNEKQVLDAIFMYILPRRHYQPIDARYAGVPFYRNFAEARAAFQARAISFRNEPDGEGWIKGAFGEHTVHYEFNQEGALNQVTVMTADA